MAKAERINGESVVLYWQKMPYELKKAHAINLIRDFYNNPEIAGNVYVSVGGLDSITLAVLVRSIYPDVPFASVSGLEHPTNQRVHKALGVISVPRGRDKDGKPYTLPKVYEEFGYPYFSKEKAHTLDLMWKGHAGKRIEEMKLINESHRDDENGMNGKAGHLRFSKRHWAIIKQGPPPNFRLSRQCCVVMKERPMTKWAKEQGRFPYMGLMESEGGQRSCALREYGCNYISDYNIWKSRSCPFASFTRDDLLRLALEMDAYYKEHWEDFNPDPRFKVDSIIPKAYGEIVTYYGKDGKRHYRTTGADRTGCTICGFGSHVRRPNQFDRLKEENPKAWAKVMGSRAEGGWGWGEVLDYFGMEWRTPPILKPEQQDIFEDVDSLYAELKGEGIEDDV